MLRETLGSQEKQADPYVFSPSFQREFNPVLSDSTADVPMRETSIFPAFTGTLFPPVNLWETAVSLAITAEISGLKVEDLNVTISDGLLTLKGKKNADHELVPNTSQLIECWHGHFCRRIQLGFTPEEGAVAANFADGVLKVTIAKPATDKGHAQKINIKKA